eukprot:scaffold576_cov260-Pinguiococcus_pyrenoidosus.AAC.56
MEYREAILEIRPHVAPSAASAAVLTLWRQTRRTCWRSGARRIRGETALTKRALREAERKRGHASRVRAQAPASRRACACAVDQGVHAAKAASAGWQGAG